MERGRELRPIIGTNGCGICNRRLNTNAVSVIKRRTDPIFCFVDSAVDPALKEEKLNIDFLPTSPLSTVFYIFFSSVTCLFGFASTTSLQNIDNFGRIKIQIAFCVNPF